MVPFRETANSKEELVELAKKGFQDFTNRIISKNDFCMFFGFTHGEAITKYYKGNYGQLLLDAGFNSGSEAYFSGGINAWINLKAGKYIFPPIQNDGGKITKLLNLPLQTIFYGAPGTGKSYKVKSEILAGVPEDQIFRTTFHPDYDYASFVGCYKPTKEDDKITYSFIPQVFTNAYVEAWKNPEQPVYLVIEEINRGNCAQIFGDLFQLLDRGNDGRSQYAIKPDTDLSNYLRSAFADWAASAPEELKSIVSGKEMLLPENLNLLATMNTSDQSLFPMDSAFKRRWDWEFVPIRYSAAETKDEKDNFHTFEIEIGGKKYKWTDFLEKVNEKILSVTDSEDKQMGEYFIKKSADYKTFINKVMYYLWSEVGKDLYGSTNPFFVQKTKNENGQDVENQFSFNDLFKENATQLLQGFMKKLEVPEVKIEEEKAATEAGEE